jgi:glycerophosphoryl diester phosphodiesterase
MCRNIKPLFNFDPPVTEQEMRDAARQFIRKISGYTKPPKANEDAFDRAVEEVTMVSKRLLESMETDAPKKNREEEAAKARARGTARYARALVVILSVASAWAEPLVIGHRGCRALRPENTIPAFHHALAVGADVLELDVVVTKDRHLVVHHDLELAGKKVHQLTLAEVRAFDRGATRSPGFTRQVLMPNVKIPKLEEAFAFARQKKARLMVETKVGPDVDPEWFAGAVDKLIRKYGLSDRILLQSFDHRTLVAMRKLNPAVGLVLLNPARNLGDYLSPAKALGPRAIQFVNFRVIDASIVNTLHNAGVQVFSGTTDDPAEWARLRALNVDGILTDDPEALRAVLGPTALP